MLCVASKWTARVAAQVKINIYTLNFSFVSECVTKNGPVKSRPTETYALALLTLKSGNGGKAGDLKKRSQYF